MTLSEMQDKLAQLREDLVSNGLSPEEEGSTVVTVSFD